MTRFLGSILENGDHWDDRFLGLAQHVSNWSRDPSTKVGCVIVDSEHRVVSLGFNGFPAGVKDTPERYADRDLKYKMVVHADANALLFAQGRTTNCTMYTWPFPPCSRCAGLIIQSGIKEVIAPYPNTDILSRWELDLELANKMFMEADVSLCLMVGRAP